MLGLDIRSISSNNWYTLSARGNGFLGMSIDWKKLCSKLLINKYKFKTFGIFERLMNFFFQGKCPSIEFWRFHFVYVPWGICWVTHGSTRHNHASSKVEDIFGWCLAQFHLSSCCLLSLDESTDVVIPFLFIGKWCIGHSHCSGIFWFICHSYHFILYTHHPENTPSCWYFRQPSDHKVFPFSKLP